MRSKLTARLVTERRTHSAVERNVALKERKKKKKSGLNWEKLLSRPPFLKGFPPTCWSFCLTLLSPGPRLVLNLAQDPGWLMSYVLDGWHCLCASSERTSWPWTLTNWYNIHFFAPAQLCGSQQTLRHGKYLQYGRSGSKTHCCV